MNGVNELDLNLQKIRNRELKLIAEEATKLREQPKDVKGTMDEIHNYLNRLHDLRSEVSLFSLKLYIETSLKRTLLGEFPLCGGVRFIEVEHFCPQNVKK